MILMSTHNICFYGEIWKIISKLSSNTHLICSSVIDCLEMAVVLSCTWGNTQQMTVKSEIHAIVLYYIFYHSLFLLACYQRDLVLPFSSKTILLRNIKLRIIIHCGTMVLSVWQDMIQVSCGHLAAALLMPPPPPPPTISLPVIAGCILSMQHLLQFYVDHFVFVF